MNRFDEIAGFSDVKKHLQGAILSSKVSHAYIIEGERGMGKKTLAHTFAKVLECEEGGIEACDHCQSCLLFDHENHPDVIHIEATKKTGLGVDDIRERINRDVVIKPYIYRYKIYIIHDADKMTIQAQNALLKTLEEPPSYVRFLLLASHLQPFLQTILSRCVVLKLKPLSQEVIKAYLTEKKGVVEYQSALLAAFSRGNIGKALELKDSEELKEMLTDIATITKVLTGNDKIHILSSVEIFEKYKENKEAFLDLLLTWLRDLMVVKSVGEGAKMIHEQQKNQLLKQVPNLSYNRISMLIDGIEQILRYDRLHINYTLLAEVALINAMNQK